MNWCLLKAFFPDDKLVEVWKCLGERAVEFLMKLSTMILDSENKADKLRKSSLVLIFKNKGDTQNYNNYKVIKLMS